MLSLPDTERLVAVPFSVFWLPEIESRLHVPVMVIVFWLPAIETSGVLAQLTATLPWLVITKSSARAVDAKKIDATTTATVLSDFIRAPHTGRPCQRSTARCGDVRSSVATVTTG